MSEMPSPTRGPAVAERDCPFWLLVPPGIACTLIWSKSSSPEYSNTTPALNVWRPFTSVEVFEKVWIGPAENAGVRSAVDPGEGVDVDGRDLVFDFLVVGEDVRVVDPGAAALVQPAR